MIRLIATIAAVVFGIAAVVSLAWIHHPTPFQAFVVLALSAIAIEVVLTRT